MATPSVQQILLEAPSTPDVEHRQGTSPTANQLCLSQGRAKPLCLGLFFLGVFGSLSSQSGEIPALDSLPSFYDVKE